MKKARFFEYHQNNSGGSFCLPAIYVIVEAYSASEADDRAEDLGLYFDGSGDCSCCGRRWSGAYGKGDTEPKIYDVPVKESLKEGYDWSTPEIPNALVYTLDGKKKIHKTKKGKAGK